MNEERFAKAFVRGKFRQKGWGRRKIAEALKRHQIGDYLWQKAFAEIDEAEYLTALEKQLGQLEKKIKARNDFLRRGKIAQRLIARGFEPELVWDFLKG